MAKKWTKFELNCTKYLNKTYSDYGIVFENQGGSDSTKHDIIGKTQSGKEICIEVKFNLAQGFQFTLIPNNETKEFLYTAKLIENSFARKIRQYMNNHYDIFSQVTTKGIPIEMDDSVFYEHAVDFAKQKNINFFISKYKKNYIIFPVEHLKHYFTISAIYRIKTSGTSNPSKKCEKDLQSQLASLDPNYELHMGNSKKKTTVETTFNLDKKYLEGTLKYYCTLISNNTYRITKCSETHNPNVIFVLKTKSIQDSEDLMEFKKLIQS